MTTRKGCPLAAMIDVLVIAGQALSVSGLLYGWYLSLLFGDCVDEEITARSNTALLHHIAMP